MARLRVLAILAVSAVLAAAAIGSGLDRMSETGAIPASAVPAPFRANAARVEAGRLLALGDYPAAAAAARRAIARAPGDAGAVGILGMALFKQNDEPAARAAFAVSRRLGWRDDLTNLFWVNDALGRGNMNEAADHLDALLRRTPELPERNLLLQGFEAEPEGREALAVRLARRPAWQNAYFADSADLIPGDVSSRGYVAERLAGEHGVHDCALVSPLIGALWRIGRFAQAYKLYGLHCAAPGEALVPADGFFRRADPVRPPTALDWSFTGEGAIGVVVQARPGWRGRATAVSNLAPVAMTFASQPLALTPGVHRLSWRALGDTGAPSAAVDAAVSCGPDEHPWAAKQLAQPGTGRFIADVTVPPDCPRQWLSLGIAAGANNVAVGEVVVD